MKHLIFVTLGLALSLAPAAKPKTEKISLKYV